MPAGTQRVAEAVDPERWARICAIFDVALDRRPDEWNEVVTREAHGDETLRDGVLRILAAQHEDRYHLEQPRLITGGVDNGASEDSERVGQTVTRYRLVRVVGRGGMGTVYEGLRADDEYTQRVAVKLIRRELAGGHIASRFRRERQILAALEHRNIARLLDGGSTARGEPFFVMEFVEGTPISRYCDEHRSTVAERLRLFLQACSAVQHAHGKLVVHSDIKPANILVAGDGSVKLLDFGVAKLLGAREGDREIMTSGADDAASQGQPRALTPEYASPEQLRGEAVSIASDIYSLGVVLYELLAGRRPFDLANRSAYAALRALEGEPLPPSAVVTAEAAANACERSAARLSRRLNSELDSIALKALSADPRKRYATVDQLGDDVRKYLNQKPVTALPDRASYRARKFVARNRTWLLGGAFGALALLGGTAAAMIQTSRAKHALVVADVQRRSADRQRKRADEERESAERTSAFLQDVLSAPDARWYRAGRPDVRVADILDAAVVRLDSSFAGTATEQASLRRMIGRTYGALTREADADKQLRRALALDSAAGSPPFPAQAEDVHELGIVRYARGDLNGAEKLFRTSVSLCKGSVADTTRFCAGSVNNVGVVLLQLGDFAKARPYLNEALRRARLRKDTSPVGAAIVLGNLGIATLMSGDIADAEPMFREQLAVYDREKALGREPAERARVLVNLADLLLLEGKLAGADSMLSQARASVARTGGGPDAPWLLAEYWARTASVYRRRGELARAATAISTAAQILKVKQAPTNALVADVETEYARVLLAEGRSVDAERVARHAMLAWSRTARPNDPRTAETAVVLAQTLSAERRYGEARSLLSQSLRTLRAGYGDSHPWTIEAAASLKALPRHD